MKESLSQLSNIDNIVKQLKNRKVFRSLAIYAGFAFVLIQVCDIVIPRLFLPEWTITFIIVLVIIGFPIIAVLSWIYDITPAEDGETPPTEATQPLGVYALTGLVLTVIGVGFWVVVGMFGVSFGWDDEVPSIGILMMDNIGGENDEFWARGITEDLIIKIAGAGLVRVASMKEILEVDIKQNFEEIAKRLRVKYLLTSSLYKKSNGFDLRSQLIEAESGNSKYANKWSESLDNAPMIVGKLASDLLKTLKVSTNQEIAKVQTISAEAYEFYLKGKHKFFTRKNKDDLHIARELLKKSIEIDNNLISAELALGYTYFDQFRHDEAFEIFSRSLKKSQLIGDKRYIANSLKAVGEIYWGRVDIEKSMQYYNEALTIFDEINDKNGLGHTYRDIGNLTAMKGELDNAIIYYGNSQDAFIELGDDIESERTLNNIGNVSIGMGDYAKAKTSLEASLMLNTLHDNKNGLWRNYTNLAYLYRDLEDYENALKYINLAKNIVISLDFAPTVLAGSLYFIGKTYYKMNQFDDALDYYNQSEKLLDQIKENNAEHWITGEDHSLNLFISKVICEIQLNKTDISEKIILINSKVKLIDINDEDTNYNYWQLFEFYTLLEDKVNAKRFLEIEYNNIIKESKKLTSDDSRKLFLHNQTNNRKVVEEWEKVK